TRFRKEVHTVSQFSHPNVVGAYALESDARDNIYLVLEYVDGGSLKQLLEARPRLDIEQAVKIAIDICNAVEAIYQRDIVHRDIKPNNILLTREGTAKLTDFGVAQVGHDTRRTQEAIAHPGTPAYKSPEQATTTGYLDQRSDLYALGLVLYEMLAGRLFVHSRSSPRHHNRDVPEALNAIVMKALEERPEDRYQTAAEMRRDLECVLKQDAWGQLRIVAAKMPRSHMLAVAGVALLLVLLPGLAKVKPVESAAELARAIGTPPPPLITPLTTPTPQIVATTEQLAMPTPVGTDTPAPPFEDVYEPDDTMPAPITVGETQLRSFNPQGDVDRVTFRVRAGYSYLIITSNLSEGVDTRLEVLVDGQNLTSDDAEPGTLASQVTFTAVQDGTVVVAVFNDDQYGPTRTYELSVIELQPTATATLLPTPTLTPLVSPTGPTRTPLPPLVTSTPTQTLTRTITPTPTVTVTLTPTHSPTPTITRTPTVSPTRTLTCTITLTPLPSNTPVPLRSPLPS
ncbi:MAG: serine/threonine protein kinase, partial [Chloroflexi bacterium]|nr:serine/threonine protein kinase [Chloroflexota bacterium]